MKVRMPIKTLLAKDITSFIALIKKEHELLQYKHDHLLLLFRGQPVDEPLLPKIARDLKWIKESGFPTSLTRLTLRKLETYMLQEFKRRGNLYLMNKPESDWDWLTHAQHHGMETRLLDWTENPLVALYFAVRESIRSENAVVWIMKIKSDEIIIPKKELDPFGQDGTKVFKPNFVSRRLEAQSGWFSIHRYLENKNSFVPLNNHKRFKEKLIRITIPSHVLKGILEELSLCGINSATLFPDLDGVSSFINWTKGIVQYQKIRMPQSRRLRCRC